MKFVRIFIQFTVCFINVNIHSHSFVNFFSQRIIKKILSKDDPLDAVVDGKWQGLEVVKQKKVPVLNRLFGYETTAHSKAHDIFKENGWKEFKLSDCVIPGTVKHRRLLQ